MRKRSRILLVVLLVAVAGGLVWQVLRRQDPVYQGESFSMWLEAAIDGKGRALEAEEAIRHIGTNGIPQLLKMLAVKDSPFKQSLIKLARKQTLVSIGRPEAARQHERAIRAIRILGPDAKPAAPALVALLNDPDPGLRLSAFNALSAIGPAASNAVPGILRHTKGGSYQIRVAAAGSLGAIHAQPGLAVPELILSLEDPVPAVTLYAIRALGKYGPDAKPAVPALTKFLQHQDQRFRDAATNALKAIDPEAAAKAGVK